ncbi:MAG: esterase, partial [Muribaculaceae bacterium]|nr:esterase [Muribaculaceae bacterium]
MKRLLFLLLVAFQSVCLSTLNAQFHQQPDESGLPGKRGILNVRSAQYPRLLPDNRMEFRVKAPDAKKVQIDLGRKYDLTRDADGVWTGTTEPLTPGFHYYFLIVDGVQVADPASESFYGCSTHTSGVEIPYPDGDTRFYTADV